MQSHGLGRGHVVFNYHTVMSQKCVRPTTSETEEDILNLQEKFLASKEISATVHLSSEKNLRDTKTQKLYISNDSKPIPVHCDFSDPEVSILQDIKEKDVSNWSHSFCHFHPEKGFPLPYLIHKEQYNSDGQKSLFAQNFQSVHPKDLGLAITGINAPPTFFDKTPMRDSIHRVDVSNTNNTGLEAVDSLSESSIISGDGLLALGHSIECVRDDLRKINKENHEYLMKMSEKDIKIEQEKLKNQLGLGLVKFLKSYKKSPLMAGKMTSSNQQIGSCSPVKHSYGKKFLNMDDVEIEKLRWIENIPVKAPHKKISSEVRFAIDGTVIKRCTGMSIPSHLGLHHHGDEPEFAGYTLKELLHLSCSLLLQQKAFSLKAIANIVQRAKNNEYVEIIEGCVIKTLLESYVPKVFRFALDDTSLNIQVEAIHGIHSLLVSSSEEKILNTYSNCYHGLSLPKLSSLISFKDHTDDELLNKDVILGLLRMMLLPRLRYILEVCKPPAEIINMIIEILIAVSRHSPNSANKVLTCPRLIDIITKQLLCTDDRTDASLNKPNPLAMKFVRILCSCGRHTSHTMVTKYSILESILRYCVIHPTSLSLSPDASHQLYIESIKTWTVLLCYGITADTFSDIFPTLLQLLSTHPVILDLNQHELLQYTSIFNLFTVSIHLFATTQEIPTLSWVHAEGVIHPVLSRFVYVMEQLESVQDMKEFSLDRVQYIASLQHLIGTYYYELLLKSEIRCRPLDLIKQIESVLNSVIIKFHNSKLFEISLNALCTCMDALPPCPTNVQSLPSLVRLLPTNAALYGQAPLNLKSDDPSIVYTCIIVFADILWSHFQLLYSLIGLHKGIIEKVMKTLDRQMLMRFMENFIKFDSQKVTWFMIPLYLAMSELINILFLGHHAVNISSQLLNLVYECGFKLLCILPPGLEACIVKLITTMFSNSSLYDIRYVSDTSSPLMQKAISMLPSLSKTYMNCFQQFFGINDKAIELSLIWLIHNPEQLNSLLLPVCNKPILPIDWPFLPLVTEYDKSISLSGDSEYLSPVTIAQVLHYIILLEYCHPKSMSLIPTGAKLTRIMIVLLTGSDLFLDQTIRPLLHETLSLYSSSTVDFSCSVDYSVPISNIASFPDLYVSLLEQYSAVSYGDRLFAQYLLLPLQQNQSTSIRKIFWLDYAHLTRVVTVNPSDIPIPINSFLYPLELEWDLIQQYFRLLTSKSLTMECNPLLYLIILHHVHHYLFNDEVKKQLRKQLLEFIINLSNKSLVKTLLLYSGIKSNGHAVYADALSDQQMKYICECGHSTKLF